MVFDIHFDNVITRTVCTKMGVFGWPLIPTVTVSSLYRHCVPVAPLIKL